MVVLVFGAGELIRLLAKKKAAGKLADRLIYGLVNVRTDGKRIAMAVMKESGRGFHVESFNAG